MILAWEWGSYLGDEGIEKGIRVRTSSYVRPQVNSVMTKGKITGQYVVGCLAKKEALLDGYDEAILLDTDGYVAEGSGENLFMVKKGVIKTPPLTAILAGITRETVIDRLKKRIQKTDEDLIETRFTRDELWNADEIFVCGTAAEITPVREMDQRIIGSGKPGTVTQWLQKEYQKIIRGGTTEESVPQDWLTSIA